jgi:hypothetical protein
MKEQGVVPGEVTRLELPPAGAARKKPAGDRFAIPLRSF